MRYNDSDWRIGYSLIPEGKYVFTVGEGRFGSTEDGSSTSRINFTLTCAEGEEAGNNTFVGFDLSKSIGRKGFAMMLAGTGVAPLLEKKFNLNADLTVQEWANKYLDVNVPKAMQVVNMALAQLAGKVIIGTVRHRTYKDKNGAEKIAADVFEFAPARAAKSSNAASTNPPTSNPPDFPPEDDESW